MALTDIAVETIQQMILDGELQPGDRLTREPDPARALGLSPASLREAIPALTVTRAVTTRQGSGSFVTSSSPSILVDAASFIADFHDDHTFRRFPQVRRVMEAEAAGRAAVRVSQVELEILSGLAWEAEVLASSRPIDHERMLANDQRFHSLITEAGGSPVRGTIAEWMSAARTPDRSWRGWTETDATERTVRNIGTPSTPCGSAIQNEHVCGAEDSTRAHLVAAAASKP